MSTFKLSWSAQQRPAYDNKGAHETVVALMRKGNSLNIRFAESQDGNSYAWIDARGVQGFKLELNNQALLSELMNYITYGVLSETSVDPLHKDGSELDFDDESSSEDFQTSMFKSLIEANYRPQMVPLFRELPEYISGSISLLKGRIVFRLRRTEEMMSYLKERGYLI